MGVGSVDDTGMAVIFFNTRNGSAANQGRSQNIFYGDIRTVDRRFVSTRGSNGSFTHTTMNHCPASNARLHSAAVHSKYSYVIRTTFESASSMTVGQTFSPYVGLEVIRAHD